MNLVEYYSDASFSPPNHIAIVGFKIKVSDIIYTKTIFDTKNTDAELIGIQQCINHFIINYDNTKFKLVIYTDCAKAIQVKEQFKTENKLGEFEIIKIEGHKPTRLKDANDKQFSIIDKYTRKLLRQRLKTKECDS